MHKVSEGNPALCFWIHYLRNVHLQNIINMAFLSINEGKGSGVPTVSQAPY